MWLWRLRSPKSAVGQAGYPGESMLYFHSEPEGLGTRRADDVSSSPSLKAREDPIYKFKHRERKKIFLIQSFICSSLSWIG